MDKKEITHVLQEIGTLLELQGENPFKSRAYVNAARALELLPDALPSLVERMKSHQVKGIGKALAEKITELAATGKLAYHEKLKASVPAGLLDILQVPGLGPKKTRLLWTQLGIESLGELEYACNENRLVVLEGFGARSQEKVLQGIERLKRFRGRYHLSAARQRAAPLLEHLARHPATRRLSIAGSLRRCRETIRDLDLVAASAAPAALLDAFASLPGVERVEEREETRATVILDNGMRAELHVVPDAAFPFALLALTGSAEHTALLRQRARARGLTLTKDGLLQGDRPLACADEAAIYQALDLAFIPPELREDYGEVVAAEAGSLPRLFDETAVRGIFHVHTTWSDGAAGAEAMALRARELGYAYLGISDHSKSAFYARGLDEERVRQQAAELAALDARLEGIRIFRGIEADILPDGRLDYDDDVLASFDFVIGSVHSHFNLSEGEMTARLCRALSNPYLTMLGHPTGRLLLARDPYSVDMHAVIDAAAEHGKIIEINANPHRLDLDWRLCRYATERGARFSINPDAHHLDGLADTAYGVAVARKGWLEAGQVVTTLDAEEVAAALARR
ncbi:MAG: DNA polymerase/3'-5' exonuclease PolX [Candidatus Tectomicrobia bacterium]|nr:DNA polymerase/3'-5' exonuclease PolX [Candidatus Tectomicrobia bacterium]